MDGVVGESEQTGLSEWPYWGRIWEKQLPGKQTATVRKAGLQHKRHDWP